MAEHAETKVGRRTIEFSNPDKVLFPADGITKREVVDYYRRVAHVMVPHLRHRPVMMARYPDGIGSKGFFQKDAPDYFPDWVHRVEVRKAGGHLTHVVCDDAATLVYLAAQACVTPHVWLSRADRIDRPDRLIFDLDPSGRDFGPVRDAAHAVGEVAEEAGLVPFVQTSGSKGLHVVAPLDRRVDFDEVRAFAREAAEVVAQRDPRHFTVEQRKDKRKGRVFIDVMRNAYAQTAVAPYSLRPLPGAPAATPLEWRELDDGRLGPRRYGLANLPQRLSQRDDPWAHMTGEARSAQRARRELSSVVAEAG